MAPDKHGNYENICLGFEKFDDYFSPAYQKAMPYFGAIIGRYANRITSGRFVIDDQEFRFVKNNLNNTLHGGMEGFDKKIWTPETSTNHDSAKLSLTYTSPDGEEGFPGKLEVRVNYELNNDNELTINYRAKTDKKTHINLTNHTYFNLNACSENVQNHSIRIDADYYSEADEENVPTGKSIPVQGSCMDFRQSKPIAEQIEKVDGNGYDHNYELNNYNGNLRLAAEAIDHESGRKLEVFTTEPGIQFYTADWLDGSLKNNNKVFSSRMGFCLETQHFPDSPNKPGFPSTLLVPSEEFLSTTIYKFSVIDEIE
jgi:aldose 1-epimerase